ncbi:hypothetical protein OHA79_32900 [Streptomyces sp. NBC_00841]|uniref:hypothetical protein n=1 Tax=Streptomyces sp. NBC_00841 TaxID=2975847 RepID=UPI002DD8F15A|nr:hypothetical protein [Streptomyces sp. NBC_00841]WSA02221.1 hypothetical protein OHA79_32900 [Streptomyces sp. NBC_00841]
MGTVGGDFSHQDTDHGTAVKFVYRPTAADFKEAFRARARRTPAGRAQDPADVDRLRAILDRNLKRL